jgi:hypothetical protein
VVLFDIHMLSSKRLIKILKFNLILFSKIAITTEHSISKALLVESLDYNLLSISQLCLER